MAWHQAICPKCNDFHGPHIFSQPQKVFCPRCAQHEAVDHLRTAAKRLKASAAIIAFPTWDRKELNETGAMVRDTARDIAVVGHEYEDRPISCKSLSALVQYIADMVEE